MAERISLNEELVLNHLLYASKLYKQYLPVIFDVQHLAYHTGYKKEYIIRAIRNPENFYRSFKIKKKNGKSRTITEPLPSLKEIQYWILSNIIKKTKPNPFNNAYTEGKSIITNAKFHRKQTKVLNIDIEKYFDNINLKSVTEHFLKLGYNNEVSDVLSRLITLKDGLPQGSPSSPYLSSILTKKLDEDLMAYTSSKKLRYSRYADDITISGDFKENETIYDVKKIVKEHGFNINPTKTTVKKQHQRQIVTGIVVNEKLSIQKDKLKELRHDIYFIKKYGLTEHLKKKQITKGNYLFHLLGKVNYYLSVRKKDKNLLKYKLEIRQLIQNYY
ncbi:reverse transcriptase family protein [Sphingobacterium siyangense]|uniref:reverse transcriptase family protein n=1 Tax=Sphingobacterium siyangense TaxID=459529 RepID=UPI003DA40341